MNAQRLLQHFNRIAEAPDAVPRLRRFILDLAVRGKLVEQDPNDEPAAELLKRIQAARARLVKAGEITKVRPLPLVEEDEAPYSSPTGWEWVRIRQVTSDRGQVTPDKDFTYIDVTAINKEVGCVADAKVLSPLDAPSRARKMVRTGDVLYSCVRPYLLNIAVIEKDIVPSPIASTAFAVLNGFGLVLSKYLWIALRSPFMVECVEAKMRGQAYPAINDSDFAILPLPLPPLAEQHRIVAKVDELMALCDRLEAAKAERENRRDRLSAASLHRLNNGADAESFREHAHFHLRHLPRLTTRPTHIKQLRQTILNLAVRGKLVPQDPKDEPVCKVFEKVLLENQNKWKELQLAKSGTKSRKIESGKLDKRYAELNIPNVQGLPQLPVTWEWVCWESILAFGDGSFKRGPFGSAITKSIFVPSGYKVYEQYCPINDDCSFARYYITPQKYKELEGFAVKARDFLISCSGVTLGRITQVPDEYEEGVINQALLRIRTENKLISDSFFKMLFRSPYFQNQIFSNSTGMAIPNVKGVKDLKAIPLPLPPLDEQHRIVAKVDELMALCDKLETRVTTTATSQRQLLEVTLHEALSDHPGNVHDAHF